MISTTRNIVLRVCWVFNPCSPTEIFFCHNEYSVQVFWSFCFYLFSTLLQLSILCFLLLLNMAWKINNKKINISNYISLIKKFRKLFPKSNCSSFACKLYFVWKLLSSKQNAWQFLHFLFQDEVVEASRQVVVECCKFSTWECTSDKWHGNVGKTLYNNIDLGTLQQALNRDKTTVIARDERVCCKVNILGFPQYNRYKTCLKMLQLGIPMTYFQLLARGGLDIANLNTLILFSKTQFEKDDVEDFSPTLDVSGKLCFYQPALFVLSNIYFIIF